MLQLKKILQVLLQGLRPIPVQPQSTSTANGSSAFKEQAPLAISLLSNKGVPLSTVFKPDQEALPVDNIRIYLLVAFNNYVGTKDESNWSLVELDANLSILIGKLKSNMFVVILYDKEMEHAVAKLKLDGLVEALDAGLDGFEE